MLLSLINLWAVYHWIKAICLWLYGLPGQILTWFRDRATLPHTRESPGLIQEEGFWGRIVNTSWMMMSSMIHRIFPMGSTDQEGGLSNAAKVWKWVWGTYWMLLVTAVVWSIACIVVFSPLLSPIAALPLTQKVSICFALL